MKIDIFYGFLAGFVIIISIAFIKVAEISETNGKIKVCLNMDKQYFPDEDICSTCEELGGKTDMFGNCLIYKNNEDFESYGINRLDLLGDNLG